MEIASTHIKKKRKAIRLPLLCLVICLRQNKPKAKAADKGDQGNNDGTSDAHFTPPWKYVRNPPKITDRIDTVRATADSSSLNMASAIPATARFERNPAA